MKQKPWEICRIQSNGIFTSVRATKLCSISSKRLGKNMIEHQSILDAHSNISMPDNIPKLISVKQPFLSYSRILSQEFRQQTERMIYFCSTSFGALAGIFWMLLHSNVWYLNWNDSRLSWNLLTEAPTRGLSKWHGGLTAIRALYVVKQISKSKCSGEQRGTCMALHNLALEVT